MKEFFKKIMQQASHSSKKLAHALILFSKNPLRYSLKIAVLIISVSVIISLFGILFHIKDDFELLKDIFEPIKKIIIRNPLFYFVLHMGALGSALNTTRTFVGKRNEKSYSWYIYRPLQGMLMAALLIYGLSAGMIGINADTGIMGIHDLEKNRYTIGFLSALAGIFAEDALRALGRISRTIFGVRERRRLRPRKNSRNNNKSTTKDNAEANH